jgi:NADP-dependent aldehyde dehydrogenase
MTTLNHEVLEETEDELGRCLQAAADAAAGWTGPSPREGADVLVAVADALDATAPVGEAASETGLSEGPLTSEVKRTTAQLRMFAKVLRDERVDSYAHLKDTIGV